MSDYSGSDADSEDLSDSDGRFAWKTLINGYGASCGGISGQSAVQIDPRVEFREKS
jgi:hypothetical protein